MTRTTATRLAIFVAVLGLPGRLVRADLTITVMQVGSDVTATGSGSFDLNGLTLLGNSNVGPQTAPEIGFLIEGSTTTTATTPDQAYSGISGPLSFGPGNGGEFPTTGSGAFFGINASQSSVYEELIVPTGYVSGTTLSATDTYANQSLSSLGLTPGTYTWTWGTGADADSLTLQIEAPAAVPEPSAAIVAVTGAVAFLAYGWSRRRIRQRRQAVA